MYIFTLLILYIILSHIIFFKIWKDLLGLFKVLQNNYTELQTKYEKLQNKNDSMQWVNGFMSPLIHGRLHGYSTRYDKHKYVNN